MNRIIAVMALAALLAVGAYFASPFYAFHQIQVASNSGDQDALEAVIDFPAVRQSLKSQLDVLIATKLQSDPKMKDNPFAGLGAMFASAIIDRLIDAYLTPEAIKAMVTRAKTPQRQSVVAASTQSTSTNTKINTSYSYITLDRFKETAVDPAQPDKPLSFVIERRGLLSWKLIRIDLPIAAFQ